MIDAAFPHKTSSGKFICSIKVVDQTFHHKSDSQSPVFATCVFYAKRIEDLPVIKRIGDLIRIHRAQKKEFQGHLQFHVNVSFNSSWCLFEQSNGSQDAEAFGDGNDSDDDAQNAEDVEMMDEEQRK